MGEYDFGDDVVNCQEAGSRSVEGSFEHKLEQQTLMIYPNPASTEITVVLPGSNHSDDEILQLLDASGMLVREVQIKGQTDIAIGVAELPRGIYLCKLHRSNEPPLIARFVLIK